MLAAHCIPFEVVPGIAAYAGIPLTHRDIDHSVTLVTGHLQDESADLDWPALARPGQTLVVYMGLLALPIICRELIAHGMPATTAAAVVQHGTLPTQRVITGTLADLAERTADARLVAPTLIIIGDVVRLCATLHWFEPDVVSEVAASWPQPQPVIA